MLRGVQVFFVTLTCLIAYVRAQEANFSAGFTFGVSTASYQVEGAWNEDGKGWSMWDHLVRTDPGHITDRSNGDIASNSYHLYKRDVEMIKELGVKAYRFSISWPRLMPYGRPDYVNPLGVAYYNNLINELLANDIEPFVTMYHWDLPQNLNEQGGLLNESFQDWFGDYARVLYENFGDRVKNWLTINEPYIHCSIGYGSGMHAPRIRSPGVGFYECGRNILLAHARAYRIYDDEGFRARQRGQIAIVISADWGIPSTNSLGDAEALLDFLAFEFGQYMDPIFTVGGNYPQRLIDRVAARSAEQGFNTSRLRPFTPTQIQYIQGTSDFLALNHYSTNIVYRNASVIGMYEAPSMMDDAFFSTYKLPEWPQTVSPWITEYAPGLYNLLHYIKDNYNNPAVYITENGCSSTTGLVDEGRVQYFRNYLSAVQQAEADGVNIKGYFAWSLMDNFEWSFGYTMRFGLYEVDIEDPSRRRTPRKSALVYKEIVRSRTIDNEYNPDPYAATANSFSTTASVIALLMVALSHLVR